MTSGGQIVKKPPCSVLGLCGQSCNQPPGGRLGKFLYRLQVLGAMEGGRERVIRRGVVGVRGLGLGGSGCRRQAGGYICVPRQAGGYVGVRRIVDQRRGRTTFGEPARPEGGDATGTTRVDGGGAVIGAEGPAWVGGDEPFFKVPQDGAGHAADDGAQGAGGTKAAAVKEVGGMNLPVHDVTATRAEGAQGQLTWQRIKGRRGHAVLGASQG